MGKRMSLSSSIPEETFDLLLIDCLGLSIGCKAIDGGQKKRADFWLIVFHISEILHFKRSEVGNV